MSTLSSVPEELKDIFARACKNNEYFGNDGWHELHTPTLKSEIQALINQQIKSVLDSIPEPTITDVFPSEPYDGTKTYEDMLQVVEYYKSTIQKIRSRYE